MSTNKKIAIDVVTLPPPEVMDRVIAINEQTEEKWGPLGKDDWLPHLSLAIRKALFSVQLTGEKAIESI